MNKPTEITMEEWGELMKINAVQDAWGIKYGDNIETFAAKMCGSKYMVESKKREYYGYFYVLFCDTPSPVTMCLIKRSSGFEVIA